MSLLPFLFEMDRPRHHDYFYDPFHTLTSLEREIPRLRAAVRRSMGGSGGEAFSAVKTDKDGFNVSLDVMQFKPEELKVKVVGDHLVVEAKHEERSDEHGYISRQFTRRYKIPETVDPQALVSRLSSDGVLSLHAPLKALQGGDGAREIPITHTNAPAVRAAPQPASEDQMETK